MNTFVLCGSCLEQIDTDNIRSGRIVCPRGHVQSATNRTIGNGRKRKRQAGPDEVDIATNNVELPGPGRKRIATQFGRASHEKMIPSEHRRSHDLGALELACRSCAALHFNAEKKLMKNGNFFSCCNHGKIQLSPVPEYPEYMRHLLVDDQAECRMFRKHINVYNSAMAFTSVQYTMSDHLRRPGAYCFVIRGELFHLSSPVQNRDDTTRPGFAQIYLYDPEAASGFRFSLDKEKLNERVLFNLQKTFEECNNPLINMYRCAHEQIKTAPDCSEEYSIRMTPQFRLVVQQGADKRRENLPTAPEVSAIIPDDGGRTNLRDIVVAERLPAGEQAPLRRVKPTHPAYMPLAYPILFPHGRPGWHWSSPLHGAAEQHTPDKNRSSLTQQMYYRHHLFRRPNMFSPIHYCSRLTQKYLVDCYSIVESARLDWIAHHQHVLRTDLYRAVVDRSGPSDLDADRIGRRIILPSSFTGSDRMMSGLYQDSMAISRRFGTPDAFVTMTANPKWEELIRYLPQGLSALDDPHLTATVFHLKRKQLLKDFETHFGRQAARCWTIEYQKRGMPHIHCLFWLIKPTSFFDPNEVDEFISAELPGESDPELHRLVSDFMIHGPCGVERNPSAMCMEKDKTGRLRCTKGFPKAFCERTTVDGEGYPLYRRRMTGINVVKRVNGIEHVLDNRWVVPYNRWLLRRYQCHINFEVCKSVKAVRYIHKYIYKGHDRVTMEIENDEIKNYVSGRYIGPVQAAFQLNEYQTHEEWPNVMCLPIHLENEQAVYFPEDASSAKINALAAKNISPLMAWFQYNSEHDDGHELTYCEFPEHYVWKTDTNPRSWTKRTKGIALGRLAHTHPRAGEVFYLGMILARATGCKSFRDCLTVHGRVQSSYKEACKLLGLLEDDGEWTRFFTTVAQWTTRGFRDAFVCALITGPPAQPRVLWDRFKFDMCIDLPYWMERNLMDRPETNVEQDLHISYGLHLIEQSLLTYGCTLSQFDLPRPTIEWLTPTRNALINRALSYDAAAEHQLLEDKLRTMNVGQRTAYDTIVSTIDHDRANAKFFVQGPGGTGKTFLYGALCHTYRSRGESVICVASSGLAATMLIGGRTAHSFFKIPLECTDSSTCVIPKRSNLAELIKQSTLIIWDEAPMQHLHNFLAVSRTLSDIRDNPDWFGGIPIVAGGDFAQTLPVIPGGSRAHIVGCCIRQAPFWTALKCLFLTKNMRVLADDRNQEFATYLRNMSYKQCRDNLAELPPCLNEPFTDELAFAGHLFPQVILDDPLSNEEYFRTTAILTPHNESVDNINDIMLDRLAGEQKTFEAADTANYGDDPSLQTVGPEVLASLNIPSLPPSRLRLKIGAPIMLLRNLHPHEGLCNGTRGIVTSMSEACIQMRILGGHFHNEIRHLFRVKLTPKATETPFDMSRHQFPIKLSFAMTINKAQGQSLDRVGVHLLNPCFAHGQLYVALSRARDVHNLTLLLRSADSKTGQDGRLTWQTPNVLYPEVLLKAPADV